MLISEHHFGLLVRSDLEEYIALKTCLGFHFEVNVLSLSSFGSTSI